MVPFFIENLVPVIHEMIGFHLANGSWALVTTPMRRHKEHNFASRIAEGLAAELGIPFYFDCAHCRSKQRIGAVFDANNIPREGFQQATASDATHRSEHLGYRGRSAIRQKVERPEVVLRQIRAETSRSH